MPLADALTIRPAAVGDMPAIATLYRHFVDHTVATWAAPGEFASPAALADRWRAGAARKLPWLVLVGPSADAALLQEEGVALVDVPADIDAPPGAHAPGYLPQQLLPPNAMIGPSRLVGYCYVGDFRPRAGWSVTVEDSIYLAPGWGGAGLGHRLLAALLAECRALGQAGVLRTVVAAISADPDDGAVGAASVALHRKHGFVQAGRLVGAGTKFGRRMDNVFLQLQLCTPCST